MEEQEIYEPPELVEVGGFAELTRGVPLRLRRDWPPDPFAFSGPED
ncbi:lasso RiPP family leader peptide-containing protein [Streptomyces sp. ISL-11]|nr:lasso RiPP family leader peptide-containing protein [Streptomyces sp. ISL-11]MBT2387347.1 lasso RiPP family leader peptide-containing protein [Streptomyces sp. ISL-11]